MELLEIGLFSYFVLNAALQIYFVRWVLWRNEKLTMLLAEYYNKH